MTKRLIPTVIAMLCLSACHRTQTTAVPTRRYQFTGRVISIDPRSESAFIYGDNIPGFMDSMGMSYKVKPASSLDKLNPGDLISAEVVMTEPNRKDENAESDYWLENVKVTGHVKPAVKPTTWPGYSCPRCAYVGAAARAVQPSEAPLAFCSVQHSGPKRGKHVAPREGDTILSPLGRV